MVQNSLLYLSTEMTRKISVLTYALLSHDCDKSMSYKQNFSYDEIAFIQYLFNIMIPLLIQTKFIMRN